MPRLVPRAARVLNSVPVNEAGLNGVNELKTTVNLFGLF
jgi:hypothetical protein